MERAFDILGLLSSRSFRSGQSIAEKLGITRAAVWRQIVRLKQVGVEIQGISGKGYRLEAAFEPLCADVISGSLKEIGCDGYDSIKVVKVVDSTNAEILRANSQSGQKALFAEYQIAGRGRRNDKWISPPGAGICFSIGWRCEQPQSSFSALGLVVGVALIDALGKLGVTDLKLKWPNDVVSNDLKMAGILIDLQSEVSGPCFAVIGIGLNIRLGKVARSTIDKEVTDLESVSGRYFTRNEVAFALLSELDGYLKVFSKQGFKPFRAAWSKYDSLLARKIKIELGNKTIIGRAEGVDQSGALLVRHDGRLEQFLSGHISML